MDIINQDDNYFLTATDIGKALGYERPKDAILKIYERNRELFEDYSTTVKLTAVDGKKRDQRIFNEEGIILLAMKSNQPIAIKMQKWIARLVRDYRHGLLSQNKDELITALGNLNHSQSQTIEAMSMLEFFRTRNNNKVSAIETAKMQGLKKDGMSNREIADYLGRSVDSVRRHTKIVEEVCYEH